MLISGLQCNPMSLKDLNDEELSALLNGREHAAFTEIYRRYWPLLFVFSRNLLRDDDEAADVVQEIFTRLWHRAGELELTGSLKSYLYAATRHLIINHIAKSKRPGSSRVQCQRTRAPEDCAPGTDGAPE